MAEEHLDDKILDRLDQKRDRDRIKTKRKTEERAAFGGVFDKYTIANVNKLLLNGKVREFVGIISAGKEANVYFAYNQDYEPIAVKIYKIDPQNTKWMKNYIIGDPRFKRIGSSTHKIIYTWCKKEFKNLRQLYRHHIQVPEVYYSRDNVLIMEFIGDQNGSPAPRLKDISELEEPLKKLKFILAQIKQMYIDAHLVHGDLSEFNILFYQNRLIIIDVSQSVSIYHINAQAFLKRDLFNVVKFFENYIPKEELPELDELMRDILTSV